MARRDHQHDDVTQFRAAHHQQEVHYEALIGNAVAVLNDAREVLRLLPNVVTDVDTHTYRGEACVTPEAATDALGVWEYQLTAMLPEPTDRDERVLEPAAEQDNAWTVGRAAEADDAARADVPDVDAVAVGVRAVGAVHVLQRPVAVHGAQYRVVPGDPGVVEDDVAQRVPPHVVVAARTHERGAGLVSNAHFMPDAGSKGRTAWEPVVECQANGLVTC